MTISQVKEKIRCKLNDLRTIDRIVSSFDFEYIYKRLTDSQKVELEQIIDNLNKNALLDFMLNQERLAIEDLTVRKLRQIASQLYIEYYSQLSKAELIRLILRSKNARISEANRNTI